MEWVETTGRTVAEALDAALDELGVDEDDVEYEVVTEPKAGLFGRIGGNPARIRARVRPMSREKPGDRQRRNRKPNSRSKGGSSRGPGGNGRGGKGAGKSAEKNDGAKPRSGGGTTVADSEPDADLTTAGRDDAQASSPATSSGPRKRRRGGRGRGSGSGSAGGQGTGNGRSNTSTERSDAAGSPSRSGDAPTTRPSSAAREGDVMETIDGDVSIEEQAQIAETFTSGLVDAFDLGAHVDISVDDDTILVSIDGSEVGLLVGPKGATLTAIEELVRTVVQRQTDGHGARINVDVGGYRAKRREALEQFTRSLAEKVIETGRAQALEPMSAMDRKVVHDAASEIDGVETSSEGEDPRRRVVVRPS
jgi:spoIIIJ-associated protein